MKKTIVTVFAVIATVLGAADYSSAQTTQVESRVIQPGWTQPQVLQQEQPTQQLQTQQLQIQTVQPRLVQPGQPGQIQQVAPLVAPYYPPAPMPRPNRFYFGMDVQLFRGYYGETTLRVTYVAPGSPAFQAGLEIGDEIRRVNGQGFAAARDSFEAVSMMNQATDMGLGGGVAAAAPAQAMAPGSVQAALVSPYPMPRPQPVAGMIVRNVRDGRDVFVNVFPQDRFAGSIGGPIAASTAAGPISPAYPARAARN